MRDMGTCRWEADQERGGAHPLLLLFVRRSRERP